MTSTYMATVLAQVPAVEETPGLIAPWSMVPHVHELYHGGAWLLLVSAQPMKGAPLGPGRSPVVALQLEGIEEVLTIRTIDRATGHVSKRDVTRHRGPTLLRTVDALCRARVRG